MGNSLGKVHPASVQSIGLADGAETRQGARHGVRRNAVADVQASSLGQPVVEAAKADHSRPRQVAVLESRPGLWERFRTWLSGQPTAAQIKTIREASTLEGALAARSFTDKVRDVFAGVFGGTRSTKNFASVYYANAIRRAGESTLASSGELSQKSPAIGALANFLRAPGQSQVQAPDVIVREEKDSWSYEVKADGDTYNSGPLSVADTAEELSAFRSARDWSLAGKVSDALRNREQRGGVSQAELARLAQSFHDMTAWEKYDAIADFVLERTNPQACMFSAREPFPLELTADDDAGNYTLKVDRHAVDTTTVPDGDHAGHTAAATSAISVASKTAMRYLAGANPVSNYRETNIECMSDDKDVQQFIRDNLDDPTFSNRNFIRIDTPDTTKNNATPSFSAVFAAADGSEKAIPFSDRIPSRGEFRAHILKDALKGDLGAYASLAELTALGHMSEADSTLVYMLSPLRENIDSRSAKLERMGANVGDFIESVKGIALSDSLSLGKILYPAG